MDFVERTFGCSPDGGSGAFEAFLFFIPIAGLALLWAWRRSRGTRK